MLRTTKQSSRITRWFISVCLSVWPSLSWGAWPQEAKLGPSDGEAGDSFGSAVSISGDYAIVGSPSHDGLGNMAGAAYIFHWDGRNWTQTHKLEASDGAAGHRFGYSVSLDGFVALVGAPYADGNEPGSGAAYVFRRGVRYIPGQGFVVVWEREAKLTAPEGKPDDQFGYAVSLEGDLALVGAPAVDVLFGRAYVFRRDEGAWILESTLTGPPDEYVGGFGCSADIHNGYATIGARFWPLFWMEYYGYASIFKRAYRIIPPGDVVWFWQEKAGFFMNLGEDPYPQLPVAMGDGWSAAGCPSESTWYTYRDGIGQIIHVFVGNVGEAQVYQEGDPNWNTADVLALGDHTENDYFGCSLAISGDYMAVGIPGRDEGGADLGAVYIYRRLVDVWGKAAALLPSGGGEGDWFGGAVAIDQGHVIVGAPLNDGVRKEDCGAAYIFRVCPAADSDGDCQVTTTSTVY